MTNETKRFLEEPVYFNCPKCQHVIKCHLKDVGSVVTCQGCGLKIQVQDEIIYNENTETIRESVQEYLGR